MPPEPSARSPLREVGAHEMVRRLASTIKDNPDARLAFFLGAGCSVSSGIPSAGDLVRYRWLSKLKQLETGDPSGFEDWAMRSFKDYTPQRAAAFYGAVIDRLFPSPERRQKEIEELCRGNYPGFGYAILAQLMCSADCGRQCNVALTTNFDDLLQDAMYIYAHTKPLVLAHESLFSYARPSERRPLVIKLHGDARLAPKNTELETRELDEGMSVAVQRVLRHSDLVFVGYSGHDTSICKMLKGVGYGDARPGVFWVNDRDPGAEFGDWLRKMNALWVRNLKFDEMMLLVLREFELEHPPRNMFTQVFESYLDTFEKLNRRVDERADGPDKQQLRSAAREVAEQLPDWSAYLVEAERLTQVNPKEAESVFRKGIEEYPHSARLLGSYGNYLWYMRSDGEGARRYYEMALRADPGDSAVMTRYADFLSRVCNDNDTAESYYQRAQGLRDAGVDSLLDYADFLWTVRRQEGEAEERYRRAVDMDPGSARALYSLAVFLLRARGDPERAEEYYQRALAAAPGDVGSLGNYANFLLWARRDYDKAEDCYRRALEAEPKNTALLSYYAGFLLERGRAQEGFERLRPALDGALGRFERVGMLFYVYAHSPEPDERAMALRELKNLLQSGTRSPARDLSQNVERARQDGHPNPGFLAALAGVISDGAGIDTLDRFAEWQGA